MAPSATPAEFQEVSIDQLMGTLYASYILDGLAAGADSCGDIAMSWLERSEDHVTAALANLEPWDDLANLQLHLTFLPGVVSVDISEATSAPYPIKIKFDTSLLFGEEIDRVSDFLMSE